MRRLASGKGEMLGMHQSPFARVLRGACFFLGICGVLLYAIDPGNAQEQEPLTGTLTIFAAASLTEPFTEIGKRFEAAHPGLTVAFNFGGSPALRTQLEQGARADLFAAADTVQMDLAKKAGIIQGDATPFANNRLVVIVAQESNGLITTFCDLGKPNVKLDLAQARVPAGNYSRLAFDKARAVCGADFAQRALHNLVSEEDNVKQVATKVQLGEADAGVVYLSDVTPQVSAAVSIVTIPDDLNQIAVYPIALTKEAANTAAARAFVAFVLSVEGQAILKAHHFLPLNPSPG
jgi:molybdate transport system substrate-binding protein